MPDSLHKATDLSDQTSIRHGIVESWHRLKIYGYENVRWDEIMRIASTQVIVTAQMKTTDGDVVRVRQSTEAEDKLSAIYFLLDINPHPLGKVKSVSPKISHQKKPPPEKQGVT